MRRQLRPVALIMMAVSVSGCFDWKTVGALPRTADLPLETRITRYDGTTIVLAQSRLENDTIRGFVSGSNTRHVIPLASVDLIEAKQFQAKRSLIAGAVLGAGLYLIVKGLQSTLPFGPMPSTP